MKIKRVHPVKLWLVSAAVIIAGSAGLTACTSDSEVVSQNVSADADNFKVLRKIVAVNGITDKYIMELEGWCSIKADRADHQLEVTCKKDGSYWKHFVGLSDNTFYFVEQLDGSHVSPDHFKIVFKPEAVIPSVEIR